jgi:hypothetical protein
MEDFYTEMDDLFEKMAEAAWSVFHEAITEQYPWMAGVKPEDCMVEVSMESLRRIWIEGFEGGVTAALFRVMTQAKASAAIQDDVRMN